MNTLAKNMAANLLQIKAIKLSPQTPFTWASGLRTPIYCDNRLTLSYPKIRQTVVQGMAEKCTEFDDIEAIAGVATAGIPHGALLADRLDLPFIYVRSKAKAHGRENKIEGELKKPSKLIVVEDLISTGKSSLEAVQALRDEGHTILNVLSIFDYQLEKAKSNFEAAQCTYNSLTTYDELFSVCS